jgi:hypothetical protein
MYSRDDCALIVAKFTLMVYIAASFPSDFDPLALMSCRGKERATAKTAGFWGAFLRSRKGQGRALKEGVTEEPQT